MLNNTSSYYSPKKIDFSVMGLDCDANEFLNWCMLQRDNLEFIMQCKSLEKPSSSFTAHLDHLKTIKRIDDALCHKRI